MPALESLLVVSIGAVIAVLVFNTWKDNQRLRTLDEAFYRLIETQNGCVSLIQLSATARIDPQLASQYLEQQARVFAAVPEVDIDGNAFYRFPRLSPPASD